MARAPREQTIETYPEADRLGDYPHPRHTEELFGHAEAEAQLAAGLASGRLHHAWLLTGPEGVGKATLAYRFARAALSGRIAGGGPGLFGDADESPPRRLAVDPKSQASRLVRALSHPDLLVIRRPYDIPNKRHRTAITVDEVRRLRDFLAHTQTGDGWKVVIVDAADELNINAANALLKSLEEPPARVLFFLVSSMPGRLLTTIRSRCRALQFKGLGEDDLRRAAAQAIAAAEQTPIEGEDWPALICAADGSVARLLELVSEDGVAIAAKVELLLASIQRTDWVAIHHLADEFSAVAAGPKFEMFIDLALGRLARLVRAAATGHGSDQDRERARMLGIASDLASWAELWETSVREKAAQASLNLDRKAYVLDLVMRLVRLAGRQ